MDFGFPKVKIIPQGDRTKKRTMWHKTFENMSMPFWQNEGNTEKVTFFVCFLPLNSLDLAGIHTLNSLLSRKDAAVSDGLAQFFGRVREKEGNI